MPAKRLHFWWASLFNFGCSYIVRALVYFIFSLLYHCSAVHWRFNYLAPETCSAVPILLSSFAKEYLCVGLQKNSLSFQFFLIIPICLLLRMDRLFFHTTRCCHLDSSENKLGLTLELFKDSSRILTTTCTNNVKLECANK